MKLRDLQGYVFQEVVVYADGEPSSELESLFVDLFIGDLRKAPEELLNCKVLIIGACVNGKKLGIHIDNSEVNGGEKA